MNANFLSSVLHSLLFHPKPYPSVGKFCMVRNPAVLESLNIIILKYKSSAELASAKACIAKHCDCQQGSLSVLEGSLKVEGGCSEHLWKKVLRTPKGGAEPGLKDGQEEMDGRDLFSKLHEYGISMEVMMANGYTTLKPNVALPPSSTITEHKDSDVNIGVDPYLAATASTSPPSPTPDLPWASLPTPPSPTRRIFGMDCEMVMTTHGLCLARLTVMKLHRRGHYQREEASETGWLAIIRMLLVSSYFAVASLSLSLTRTNAHHPFSEISFGQSSIPLFYPIIQSPIISLASRE